MRGTGMEIDWRTVQMFLDDDGVFEVETDADDYTSMRCTCPTFAKTKKCKHSKLVKKRIDENGGTYSIQIPESVPEETILEAMLTRETFRDLIIHHAAVEVLE